MINITKIYYENNRPVKLDDKTIKQYTKQLEIFKSYCDKYKVDIFKMDKEAYQRIITDIQNKGYKTKKGNRKYSNSSIKLMGVAIHKFFDFLIENKNIKENICYLNGMNSKNAKSELLKYRKAKKLDQETINKIFDYIDNAKNKNKTDRIEHKKHLKNAIVLMLCFGLRISELLKLDSSCFKVNGLIKLHIKESKFDKVRDTYFIGNQEQKEQVLEMINNNDFCFQIGKIQTQLQRISKELNIKHLSAHSFRHTFATNYLKNSGHIHTLAKLLGHLNINSTEIYADIPDIEVSDEILKVEEKLV